MPERPIFVIDNILHRWDSTVTAGDSGFEKQYLWDGLHYTSWKRTGTGAIEIKATRAASDTATIDAIVIDSVAAHGSATFTIVKQPSSVTFTATPPTSISKGTNLILADSTLTGVTEIDMDITGLTTPNFRHVWFGRKLQVKFPEAPFDPRLQLDFNNVSRSSNQMVMGRDIKTSQYVLDAAWRNLDSTSSSNFDTLKTDALDKNLGFWWFFLPTTQPDWGRLFYPDMAEWSMPYTGSGDIRNAQIYAVANTEVDRDITFDQT